MMWKFINWLLSFLRLSKKIEAPNLPQEIGKGEKLCRAIYSTINLTANGGIKANAFRTPANKDEVSVNRLDFTIPSFCKSEAKKTPSTADRNYYGFAIVLQSEILEADCTTIYSPILGPAGHENYFHADIKIGYIPIKGQELPSSFSKKINDLTKKARLYKDPNIGSPYWEGEELL